MGLKFYFKDIAFVLKTGFDTIAERAAQTHTVHLEDGERVIGYKSRTFSSLHSTHYDF